jgi:hypothetical protein
MRFPLAPAMVITVAIALFAFDRPGAHSLQVYLDDRLVLEQYVTSSFEAPQLRLDPAKGQKKLDVRYNECGRAVTGRALTIKDEAGKVLRVWEYDGSVGYRDGMTCEVKDLIALKQPGSNLLKLYYSSKEFSQGQHVANLVIGGEVKASLK